MGRGLYNLRPYTAPPRERDLGPSDQLQPAFTAIAGRGNLLHRHWHGAYNYTTPTQPAALGSLSPFPSVAGAIAVIDIDAMRASEIVFGVGLVATRDESVALQVSARRT